MGLTHSAGSRKTHQSSHRADASALYLVDQDQSDFRLSQCNAPKLKDYVENEVEHMIDQGYSPGPSARKEACSYPPEITPENLFYTWLPPIHGPGHVCGLLPDENQKIPDTSLTLLSIILLNIANALESLEFYTLLRNQNTTLEKKVEERTEALARSERQLQQVLKNPGHRHAGRRNCP